MSREPYRRDPKELSMNLPDGCTCGDCFHFPRCNKIFGHIEADEICDWAPSRFVVGNKAIATLHAQLAESQKECERLWAEAEKREKQITYIVEGRRIFRKLYIQMREECQKVETALADLKARWAAGVEAWVISRHESDDKYLFWDEPEYIGVDDCWVSPSGEGIYLGEFDIKGLEPGHSAKALIILEPEFPESEEPKS